MWLCSDVQRCNCPIFTRPQMGCISPLQTQQALSATHVQQPGRGATGGDRWGWGEGEEGRGGRALRMRARLGASGRSTSRRRGRRRTTASSRSPGLLVAASTSTRSLLLVRSPSQLLMNSFFICAPPPARPPCSRTPAPPPPAPRIAPVRLNSCDRRLEHKPLVSSEIWESQGIRCSKDST